MRLDRQCTRKNCQGFRYWWDVLCPACRQEWKGIILRYCITEQIEPVDLNERFTLTFFEEFLAGRA